MKILHVVAYFPPDRMGGVGEVVAHLHRSLLARGHESHILTTGISHDDARVERIARSPLIFLFRLLICAKKAGRFDLVHCHHGDAVLMMLAMRVLRVRTPVLVTYHVGHRCMARAHAPYCLKERDGERCFGTGYSGFAYRNGKARFHLMTDLMARKLANEISFISRSAAIDVLGPVHGRCAHVIYNAVPAADGSEDESDADSSAMLPEPVELLYVGTDGPRKRLLALPFVLEHVRRTHPGARLRLVGVDPMRSPELTNLFTERGLSDAVICEGVLRSDQVPRYYRAAQVLLVPSIYEGLPMVILEAQSYGLACVATRVSGHPEVIEDGVNGFLVEPDNPIMMAERCTRLLSNEKLCHEFAAAGRKVVSEQFNLERQCTDYLTLYRNMIETGSVHVGE